MYGLSGYLDADQWFNAIRGPSGLLRYRLAARSPFLAGFTYFIYLDVAKWHNFYTARAWRGCMHRWIRLPKCTFGVENIRNVNLYLARP